MILFGKIVPPPTHLFEIFILHISKKGGGVETMCIHLEILEIILVSFCVFPLEHFDDI